MGLNQEFDVVKSQILSMDPLPKVSKAFAMVASAESQKNVSLHLSASTTDTSAMFAKASKPKSPVESKLPIKKSDNTKKILSSL